MHALRQLDALECIGADAQRIARREAIDAADVAVRHEAAQLAFEAIDLGSPSTFESACLAGLHAASTAFYNALNNIDTAALEFDILGTARGIDKNHDGKMDDIQTGVWTGQLGYAGTPAPLSTAKFFGTKM